MNEFELIARYFAHQPVQRPDVSLPIGDDAAAVSLPPGHELLVTTDLLIEGVHFPAGTDPADIGHKALAVNLSDLAAMGATPAWFTLGLTLPEVDESWLAAFCRGLYELAAQHQMQLIGGDTTRGPVRLLAITALGFAPRGSALTRSGARPGDQIYVTGQIGDAALGLAIVEQRLKVEAVASQQLLARLNRPMPQIAAGLALRGIASACIDLSDGLVADLGHILEASRVGAVVQAAAIPCSSAYRANCGAEGVLPALTFGDDYELCFTVPPMRAADVASRLAAIGVKATRIGEIVAAPGLQVLDEAGKPLRLTRGGFDHFARKES